MMLSTEVLQVIEDELMLVTEWIELSCHPTEDMRCFSGCHGEWYFLAVMFGKEEVRYADGTASNFRTGTVVRLPVAVANKARILVEAYMSLEDKTEPSDEPLAILNDKK